MPRILVRNAKLQWTEKTGVPKVSECPFTCEILTKLGLKLSYSDLESVKYVNLKNGFPLNSSKTSNENKFWMQPAWFQNT
jgi:hypothetical protein